MIALGLNRPGAQIALGLNPGPASPFDPSSTPKKVLADAVGVFQTDAKAVAISQVDADAVGIHQTDAKQGDS